MQQWHIKLIEILLVRTNIGIVRFIIIIHEFRLFSVIKLPNGYHSIALLCLFYQNNIQTGMVYDSSELVKPKWSSNGL